MKARGLSTKKVIQCKSAPIHLPATRAPWPSGKRRRRWSYDGGVDEPGSSSRSNPSRSRRKFRERRTSQWKQSRSRTSPMRQPSKRTNLLSIAFRPSHPMNNARLLRSLNGKPSGRAQLALTEGKRQLTLKAWSFENGRRRYGGLPNDALKTRGPARRRFNRIHRRCVAGAVRSRACAQGLERLRRLRL